MTSRDAKTQGEAKPQLLHLVFGGELKSLDSHEFAARVRADFSGGVRSGVNGTPTFFINGQRHDGPFDHEYLVEAIEAALATTHH